MTTAPRQNDRLDQALLCRLLVETGASAGIENSEIRYNIRRVYTMPVVETGFTKARSLFIRNGGMLRTSKAIRLGVHPRTLYALRDAGELEQVGRGLYRLASAPQLTSPDVIPIAMRVPRAVVCLISALAHHGLTTQVPHSVDIALPSHSQIPKIDGIPVRVFWYSEPSFSSGIDLVSIDGVLVRVYSPEKTIADCFKYRNKIGLDVAIEALRNYRERKRKPDFKAMSAFAKINRVERIMRPYLESLL
jgi:predicted transcriptional regulator of viral defense system